MYVRSIWQIEHTKGANTHILVRNMWPVLHVG